MSLSSRILRRGVAATALRLGPAPRIRSPGALRLAWAGPTGACRVGRRGFATSLAVANAEPRPSDKRAEEETPGPSAKQDPTSHAVVSTFDLFSIGVGPSSSHTVGPMRAGKIFAQDLVDHGVLDRVVSIKIDLYGSLALTGIGHGTPNATLMGLEGELPETVPTETINSRVEAMYEMNTITLNGTHRIRFNPDKDMTLHYYESLPQHPNGMRFTVFNSNGDMLATNEFFSIGGGFVVNEKTQVAHGENVFFRDSKYGQSSKVPTDSATASSSSSSAAANSGAEGTKGMAQTEERRQQDLVTAALPFRTGSDLVDMCKREGLSIAEVVFLNELQWRSREDVINSAYRIWGVMDDSIRRGCLSSSKKLPGRLNVRRRAPHLYQNLMRGIYGSSEQDSIAAAQSPALADGSAPAPSATKPSVLETSLTSMQRNEISGVFKEKKRIRRPLLPHLDYLSVYAIAVNEENAAGGRVVTAPTNGAAGVIPAVLKYYLEFLSEDPSRDILEFLFTSAAIGMLYKRGASISAAEMGCQGEVGVACSMSAAAFAAVMGGTPEQVENAAEIGMEHNLGLTCDPVDGLVQIPCIERNALGAVKAVTAAQLALQGDGSHRVSLDQVIETMRQTGQDMMSKYKETSQGGLAVNVPIC